MKRRNWFWGIFFILATVVLIASQVTPFTTIGFWSLLGAIILIAVIIQSAIYRVWAGIFIPVALLYLIFQAPLGWVYLSPWILIIAAIFLSIAFHLLLRSKPRWEKYAQEKWQNAHGEWKGHAHEYSDGMGVSENQDDNHPEIKVSFGNVTRYLRSTCLEYGRFSTSFGAIEAYFDQATLSPEGAELFVESSFGAIKLFVPRTWNVVNRVHSGMGGVTFKGVPALDANPPCLTLTGNVSMGGVEVYYV